jgi:glycosyltransferase involved in cell wall biosynthesis
MRVVFLNPCGQMGGAETSLRELLAGIRVVKPSWELFLVLGEDGPLASIARSLKVEVIVAGFPPLLARVGDAGRGRLGTVWSLVKAAGATAGYTRKLARILGDLKPDFVHSNGFKMHLLGAWTRPPKAHLVWHIHDYVRTRPVMSRLLREHGKRCDAAIANSNSVAAELRELFPHLNVTTIYNAIDLDRFAPSGNRLDLDALSGLRPAAPGTVRVGLVATFARWKGHKVFLQALSCLGSESPVRAYVIGGPIYQTNQSQWSVEELQQEASRLGLGDKIGFTGFLDDTAAAMRSLDVVVHASTQPEPFGMVIIEGMACGKAVIASQGGGASELFVNGENALAHRPGDATGLAEQIGRLAADAALRIRLGEAGRATAKRLYHRHRLANELVHFYSSVGCSGDKVATPAHLEAEAVAWTPRGND